MNYSKKFVRDILILFDILYYCFNEEENDYYLLKYVVQDLKEKYKKVIIPDSILNSIEINNENYFGLLNQLLNLNFEEIYDVQILIYKDLKFQMRKPSNKELDLYLKSDFDSRNKKKKKRKNKNFSTKNSFERNEQNNKINDAIEKDSLKLVRYSDNQATNNSISKDIDISKMSPVEKFLYDD